MGLHYNKMAYKSFLDSDIRKSIFDGAIVISEIGNVDRKTCETLFEILDKTNFKKLLVPSTESKYSEISKIISADCLENVMRIDTQNIDDYIGRIIDEIDVLYKGDSKVVINATSIKRKNLLPLITMLRSVFSSIEIFIIYITPILYGDYEIDNYSEPSTIAYMHGLLQIGKPTMLLLMTGYEKNGEFGLIRYYFPSNLIAGYASPPTENEFEGRNIIDYKDVVQHFANEEGIEIDNMIFTGNNPIKCCEDLEKKLNSDNYFGRYNILVAPMNNKISSIGACLLYEKYPEIQLVDINGKKVSKKEESGKMSVYSIELPRIAIE
ncbi:MAG: hypothetical protein CVU95_04035 [Firmicutes bacterium HGW-Firmicutes-2]|jgi:hypothetical protein|nr:MAG: hypothetical protein CVU95_04035 [Firmicutes bacterium HGW-Firmicutes-2]